MSEDSVSLGQDNLNKLQEYRAGLEEIEEIVNIFAVSVQMARFILDIGDIPQDIMMQYFEGRIDEDEVLTLIDLRNPERKTLRQGGSPRVKYQMESNRNNGW